MERASGRLLQTLDVLFERPILNIRQLEGALDVHYRTAQRYIERLEEIGVLRELTGQARKHFYQADEIIASHCGWSDATSLCACGIMIVLRSWQSSYMLFSSAVM
jgi:hypothetical protein